MTTDCLGSVFFGTPTPVTAPEFNSIVFADIFYFVWGLTFATNWRSCASFGTASSGRCMHSVTQDARSVEGTAGCLDRLAVL